MPARAKAKPTERVPSAAEQAARARTLKTNQKLAEQFGIGNDPPRELVKVDSLPDPPGTEPVAAVQSRRRRTVEAQVNVDEVVLNILKDEMEEIGTRLDRFGVKFDPAMRQDTVDHIFALLGGLVQGGGAIATR